MSIFARVLNWNRLIKNLDIIKEQAPHVVITITTTVSVFNIYYLFELYSFFLTRHYIKAHGITFNMLLDPEEYSLSMYSQRNSSAELNASSQDDFQKIKQSLPNNNFQHCKNQLQGVLDFLWREDRSYQLKQFSQQTQALDKIRNESFANIYPELATLITN